MAKLDGMTAKRYVRALAGVVPPAELETIRDALANLAAAYRESVQLQASILSPAVPSAEKEAAVRDIARVLLPGHDAFSNFLLLLLENHRFDSLEELVSALDEHIRELRELLSLRVTSAFELPADERSALQQEVQRNYGALASIEWLVDPSLIGGLRIQAGDRLLDNSVATSLERMRSVLVG